MTKDRANRALAEAEARRLWKLYDLHSIEDLVLEDLAYAMGVSVVRAPLEGAEARLVRRGDRGLIRVREGIGSIGQERFAIAHELGHWVLHRASSQVAACTQQDLLLAYKSSPEEQEASAFASVLLMPDELFKAQTSHAKFSARTIRRLADLFQTSLTASAIRFVETSSDYCALVVSRAGRVEWWRSSDDFTGRLRMSPNRRVPAMSLAADVFAGKPLDAGPKEVPFDEWSDEHDDEITGDILEDIIFLESFGTVLSLLSLP